MTGSVERKRRETMEKGGKKRKGGSSGYGLKRFGEKVKRNFGHSTNRHSGRCERNDTVMKGDRRR